jgi:hypothetical protein
LIKEHVLKKIKSPAIEVGLFLTLDPSTPPSYPLLIRYSWMAWEAFLSAPMASITKAAPVAISPLSRFCEVNKRYNLLP